VVAAVRRQLGLKAVGHAGTLDPFATGLLVVLVGRATRLARFVSGTRKNYHATVRIGVGTDTDDATGTTTAELTPADWPTAERLTELLAATTGAVMQRPPAYSAKHVQGTRSHRLARRGHAVELPAVPVEIHRLVMTDWRPPELELEAEVGPGTYIRALARDLGDAVGLPAHCQALRRTRVGPFEVADAISPEAVSAAELLPTAALVPHLIQCRIDAQSALDLQYGRIVARHVDADGPAALLDDEGQLVAVAMPVAGGWQPTVVMVSAT
jgi:tRNA pseudouridine55 synthase